jgi:DNA-binding transcriptional MerR regulator
VAEVVEKTPMTMAEVHRRTGVPVDTLRHWRWRGTGGPPSYKLGRRVVYDPAAVDAWVASQRVDTGRGDDREAAVDAWVQKQLETAPPLTSDQRELLRRLLRPIGRADGPDAA